MIISEYVTTKISSVNYTYWKNLGYPVKPAGGRCGKNNGQILRVKVSDLLPKSCVVVKCRCDVCGNTYKQRYARNTDICYPCRNVIQMRGNSLGRANKGKKGMSGKDHPRWNPNKDEFSTYMRNVRYLSEKTYKLHKETINPNNYPRTLCGVEGGYQLDHVISIKTGFRKKIPPKKMAAPGNLQMLPWADNREKW